MPKFSPRQRRFNMAHANCPGLDRYTASCASCEVVLRGDEVVGFETLETDVEIEEAQ